MKECEHLNFVAQAIVNRITGDNGRIFWAADIEVNCADCSIPFVWIGAPVGIHPLQPTRSVDGIQLRAHLEPSKPRKNYLRGN